MVSGKSRHLNKVIFFIALTIIFLAGAKINSGNVKPVVKLLFMLKPQSLSNGDLIFRKGHDLISSLILTQGNSAQYSHVGIILKQGDQVLVAHSLPESAHSTSGVQIESLSTFTSFDNAADIALYRLKGIDGKIRQKIIKYILQQIGKPFDTEFLLSTDDRMYCTELVIKAFSVAGEELTANVEPIKIMLVDELVIPPDHLRQSPRLKRLPVL